MRFYTGDPHVHPLFWVPGILGNSPGSTKQKNGQKLEHKYHTSQCPPTRFVYPEQSQIIYQLRKQEKLKNVSERTAKAQC